MFLRSTCLQSKPSTTHVCVVPCRTVRTRAVPVPFGHWLPLYHTHSKLIRKDNVRHKQSNHPQIMLYRACKLCLTVCQIWLIRLFMHANILFFTCLVILPSVLLHIGCGVVTPFSHLINHGLGCVLWLTLLTLLINLC